MMRINPILEILAGILILSVCSTILYLEYAEGSPKCDDSQCTIELPNSKEFRLNQVCDMQEQSDDTLIYCVFDVKGNDKLDCYAGLKQLDQEVLRLEKKFKKDFNEYPSCPSNLETKWDERKK